MFLNKNYMEIDTICLSGGGMKGFSFLGALDYLNNVNYININKITNWVGTSAGSIFIVLFSIGYTPVEIGDFFINFDLKKLDPDISVDNVFSNYGISNGERFEFILKSFLKNKLGVEDITFKNLNKVTKKNILIVGVNFTRGCEEVFSHENTPCMSIITAIRISCSIPLFFTPVLYNGCYYVDGGIINNFPINYCNKKTTLGLYIKNNNFVGEISSIVTIIIGCLAILNDTITLKNIKDCDNIIQIDNYANETINFDITIDTKIKIINLGQIYARKYVENFPKKICSDIINNVIDNIENEIKKTKFQDQSTQTDF